MPPKNNNHCHFVILDNSTGKTFDLFEMPTMLEATAQLRDEFAIHYHDMETEISISMSPELERMFTKASLELDEFIVDVLVALNRLCAEYTR